MEKYAKSLAAEHPEWQKWAKDKAVKFWAEISVLVEGGKCELLTDTADGRIYLSRFYPNRILKAYQNIDVDAEVPFHSEESLKITLPENQVRSLNCGEDLAAYLAEPQTTEIPVLRFTFPEAFGSALILASMIPQRFMELAILKIRNYLHKSGNKEYILRKMMPQLQGRESNLREQFNRIMTRPLDCYSEIKEGGEFACLFWPLFCSMLKGDVKKKKESLNEDIAAIQSVYFIETVSAYYKGLAIKRRESEAAFKNLEFLLAKPPFLFTLDQICKFTNAKGMLLLGQYSNEELQAWLKQKTTESQNNALPVLLIVRGGGEERFFIFKDKMPALCLRLLAAVRPQVKEALTKRWRKLLLEYGSEPAMESSEEFEKTLFALMKKYKPLLATLLEDPILALAYDEVEQSGTGIPSPARIFASGQMLPYSTLLLVQRKDLLTDAKLMLPLWYSLPILRSIAAFFKNLGKKKKVRKAAAKEESSAEEAAEEKDRSGEIRAAAKELEAALIPAGHTIESYMDELEPRWSKIIDKQARKNLSEDVKSLLRDNLRKTLRIKRHFKLTRELVREMAQNIVTRTPALASLSGRDSLILYAELYLVKLLRNLKHENFK
ncbi:MAG: hypothetical protein FWB99_07570 [Treponema sp.]|nr:hypothetical protein [Treponema sp.]